MRCIRVFLVLAIFAAFVNPSTACDWLLGPSPSIRAHLAEAQAVLFGRFENARKKNDADFGETDLVVHEVLKSHLLLKDRKKFVIPRYIPTAKPHTFLVFADVEKGKLDFYFGRGTDERGIAYVRSIMNLDPKKPVEMLRFYIDHLEHPNTMIAEDALTELRTAAPAVRQEAARNFEAAKVWRWVRDAEIDRRRRNLYASLLGACGKPGDADELFKLANELGEYERGGDGLYFAVLLLKPKEYATRVKALAADAKVPFVRRYAILQAVRALDEMKSPALSKAQVLEIIECFVQHGDMYDFAVEDFRKWKRWEYTEKLIDFYEQKKTHQGLICRNALLRFALQSPSPRAAAFVAKMRKDDPELVRDTEELMK